MLLFIWLKETNRALAFVCVRATALDPSIWSQICGCVFYVLHGLAVKLGETS